MLCRSCVVLTSRHTLYVCVEIKVRRFGAPAAVLLSATWHLLQADLQGQQAVLQEQMDAVGASCSKVCVAHNSIILHFPFAAIAS